jgi:hypothetical protein
MNATERGPVPVAPAENRPSDDDAVLEGMIGQMVVTTEHASRAIDQALEFVEASNRRIEALEAEARRPR